MFPNIGVGPQNGWFTMVPNPIKMGCFGGSLFWVHFFLSNPRCPAFRCVSMGEVAELPGDVCYHCAVGGVEGPRGVTLSIPIYGC